MLLLTLFLDALSASSVLAATISQRQENSAVEIDSYKPTDEIAKLAAQGIEYIKAYETKSIESRSAGSCNLGNVVIRRDWEHLSGNERKAYSSAVLCLMDKPSILDQTIYPGAKSRYDDFVAVHINQTLKIHGTGNFLSWHRYYIWAFEQALRNECGYTGYQPYWNWATHASNPGESPVFDGSATSMGGNGEFLLHNGSLAGTGMIFLPSEQGGGCVTQGPFKDMKVNLGPISPTQDGIIRSPSTFAYNPRCLKRDISTKASSTWLNLSEILSLILNPRSISAFQNQLQGDFPNKFLGAHAAGHFTMNGDPGGDFFASPGDPAFWLHHAMVDRTWWIWQSLNLPGSLSAVAGTITINNNPPSRNTTLQDLQDLGDLGAGIPLGDLLSTLSGPFCYIYL